MIIFIIFSSFYLFITSDYYIDTLYYFFIHFLLYIFYINKKNFFRFFLFIFSVLTLATPILLKEISIDFSLEIPVEKISHNLPETLIYISLYLSILVMVIIIFSSYFAKKRSLILDFSILFNRKSINPILIIFFIIVLAVSSFFWLLSINYFSYITERPTNPFIVVALVSFSLLTTLILCLGYMIKNNSSNSTFMIFLYLFVVLSAIFFSIKTGSRIALMIPIVAFIYNHKEFFKKKIWLLIFLFPSLTVIFYSMEISRNSESNIVLSNFLREKVFYDTKSFIYFTIDIITNRFNYLKAINEVFLTFSNNFNIKEDYLQNIYGFIPRVLWPDKPIMGLNLNYIGIEIKALDPLDKLTSYSIHYIGESFYQLRWFGLIIAFLQAIILAKIDSIKENISITNYTLSFKLTIFVVMTGSLLTFLPELFLLITPIIVLCALLNTRSNE